MTGNVMKTHTTEEKSPIEVRVETAKVRDSRRIGAFRALSARRIGHGGDPAP